MQKSLDFTVKLEKFQLSPIGSGIILILFGTAFLSLRTPARDYLFPYAAYLQLSLQVGVFAMLVPFMHINTRGASFGLLMGFYTLFIVALSSSLWSSYPDLVFQRTLLIFVPSLLVAVLTLADTKPVVTFTQLAKALALFGAMMSLLGLIACFFGKLEMTEYGRVQSIGVGLFRISQRVYGFPPFLRISSLFGNPNTLASLLLVTLPMTVYLFLNGSRRAAWGFLALFQGSALILTFSRAGVLAALASLALLGYLSASNRRLRGRRAFILGLLALGLVLVIAIFGAPQSERLSLDPNLRQLAWMHLWTSIRNNPMLGVGFGVNYEAILEPEGLEFGAHNAFLTILSEFGLPGFLLFVLLWLTPMWLARKKLQFALPSTRLTLAAGLAILLSLTLHQVVEGSILRYSFANLMWVYLLALMIHSRLKVSNAEKIGFQKSWLLPPTSQTAERRLSSKSRVEINLIRLKDC